MSEDDRWFSRQFSDLAPDVTEFVLNAPVEGNRLTTSMMSRLAEAIAAVGSSASCRVIVLSAEGDDFCLGRAAAGPDLGFTPSTSGELIDEIEGSLMKLFSAIRGAPVPVAAVVRGRAVGFGCALAAACDLTIAGPSCAFQLDEMGHGKPPLMAVSVLSRYVPEKILASMIYTTAPVVGADAVAAGLASIIVDTDDELGPRAAQVIDGLRGMPPQALRTVKEYLSTTAGLEPRARAKVALAMFANAVAP